MTMSVFQYHPFIPMVQRLAPSMQPVIRHIIEVDNTETTFLGSSPIRRIELVIPREPMISQVSNHLRFKWRSHLLTRDPVTLGGPIHRGNSCHGTPFLCIPHGQWEVFSFQPVSPDQSFTRKMHPQVLSIHDDMVHVQISFHLESSPQGNNVTFIV